MTLYQLIILFAVVVFVLTVRRIYFDYNKKYKPSGFKLFCMSRFLISFIEAILFSIALFFLHPLYESDIVLFFVSFIAILGALHLGIKIIVDKFFYE